MNSGQSERGLVENKSHSNSFGGKTFFEENDLCVCMCIERECAFVFGL